MQAAAHGDPGHAHCSQLRHARETRHQKHVQRSVHRTNHLGDLGNVREARGVDDVGAGLLVSLEPSDGVREIAPAAQVVLGPRRQHQASLVGVRDLCGGRDPIDRSPELVDRVGELGVVILDGAAGEPRRGREPQRFRDAGGLVREAVLEVGAHRERRCRGDRRGVGQGLVATQSSVETPERPGRARAGGGEGAKAKRGEELCTAGVPGVGEQQRLAGAMEIEEALRLGEPAIHCQDATGDRLPVRGGVCRQSCTPPACQGWFRPAAQPQGQHRPGRWPPSIWRSLAPRSDP